jgi:hypothetical protein
MTRQTLVRSSIRGSASHRHCARDAAQIEQGSVILRLRVNLRSQKAAR